MQSLQWSRQTQLKHTRRKNARKRLCMLCHPSSRYCCYRHPTDPHDRTPTTVFIHSWPPMAASRLLCSTVGVGSPVDDNIKIGRWTTVGALVAVQHALTARMGVASLVAARGRRALLSARVDVSCLGGLQYSGGVEEVAVDPEVVAADVDALLVRLEVLAADGLSTCEQLRELLAATPNGGECSGNDAHLCGLG